MMSRAESTHAVRVNNLEDAMDALDLNYFP